LADNGQSVPEPVGSVKTGAMTGDSLIRKPHSSGCGFAFKQMFNIEVAK